MVVCPGCGARNEADARICDWCGRPFVAEQRQITAPWLIPATIGAISLLAVVTIIAALLGARSATPRATADVAASTASITEVAQPTTAEAPAPEAAAPPAEAEPGPAPEFARIANTGGAGAFIRRDPQANAPGLIALRDGAVVRVVGADTTVANRLWRNVEDQRGNRGWTPAEYLAPSDTGF